MKLVIVGHVDHGKSTLIGRLLYDTKSLPADRVREVEAKCKRLGKEMEFSFLLDALEEEHEQTITIDTTQVTFKTQKREYLIIDAPGHKEFLKNMVSGAASAQTAILIVDAKEGIKEQTKRHAYLLGLLGMKDIIVAINKMDLVDYSKDHYSLLSDQIVALVSSFGMNAQSIVPVCAKTGENLSLKSTKMPWYEGPILTDILDNFPLYRSIEKPLRFPVQDIYHWNERITAGRVESGRIRLGDRITFYPSLKKANITLIKKWNIDCKECFEGECVGLEFDDQLFIERGEIGAMDSSPPTITQEFRANVFWLGNDPLKVNKNYKIKCLTYEGSCEVVLIKKRVNSSTLAVIQENASEIENTEVGELVIRVDKPIALDAFKDNEKSGRFVIVDGLDVAGGGIVIDPLGSTQGTETF